MNGLERRVCSVGIVAHYSRAVDRIDGLTNFASLKRGQNSAKGNDG